MAARAAPIGCIRGKLGAVCPGWRCYMTASTATMTATVPPLLLPPPPPLLVCPSELDKHLSDADVVITTPFHPAYMTK